MRRAGVQVVKVIRLKLIFRRNGGQKEECLVSNERYVIKNICLFAGQKGQKLIFTHISCPAKRQ